MHFDDAIRVLRFSSLSCIAIGLIGACVVLLGPAVATAQTPAGVDQYQPQPPGGDEDPDDGSDEDPDDGDDQDPDGDDGDQDPGGGDDGNQGPLGGDSIGPSATATGDLSGGGDGSLPFTGYPLTTLALVMLALVIAGLSLRAALAARNRVRRPAA